MPRTSMAREQIILALGKTTKPVTREEIAKRLRISPGTAGTHLAALESEGKVRRVGTRNVRRSGRKPALYAPSSNGTGPVPVRVAMNEEQVQQTLNQLGRLITIHESLLEAAGIEHQR